jgi:hypothetical protein
VILLPGLAASTSAGSTHRGAADQALAAVTNQSGVPPRVQRALDEYHRRTVQGRWQWLETCTLCSEPTKVMPSPLTLGVQMLPPHAIGETDCPARLLDLPPAVRQSAQLFTMWQECGEIAMPAPQANPTQLVELTGSLILIESLLSLPEPWELALNLAIDAYVLVLREPMGCAWPLGLPVDLDVLAGEAVVWLPERSAIDSHTLETIRQVWVDLRRHAA